MDKMDATKPAVAVIGATGYTGQTPPDLVVKI